VEEQFIFQDLILSLNAFALNFADRFGGALGLSFQNSNDFNASGVGSSGIFVGNVARLYGSDAGSSIVRLWVQSTRSFVYQGEPFEVQVHMLDAFNQTAFPESCTIRIFMENNWENGSLLDNDELFILEPSSFFLSEKPQNQVLALKVGFYFYKAMLNLPIVTETLNVSLKVVVNGLESNLVHLVVGKCPFGSALESDSVLFYKCIPCLPGAFLNSSDPLWIRCSKCPAGTYSLASSTSCLSCPKGRFSDESGGVSDLCVECPLGTFGYRVSQSVCDICSIGKYSDQSGETVCKSCPFASVTLQDRAFHVGDCVCPVGFFGVPVKEKCSSCPKFKGLRCDANSTVPFIEKEYWRLPGDVSVAQECIPSFACLESGFLRTTPCALNFEGSRCGSCADGMYLSSQSCWECPSSWLILLIVTAFVCIVLGACIYLIFSSRGGFMSRSSFRPILVSIQSLGIISRFFSKDASAGSGLVNRMLSFLDLSNVNLDFLFGLDCLGRIGFWDTFMLRIIALFSISVFLLVGCYLYEKVYRKSRTGQAGAKFYFKNAVFDKCISLLLMLTSTFYTFVLSMILSAFRCYPQEDGTFTLLPSPSLDCYDSEWYKHVWIIVLGIMFLAYFPVQIGIVLWKNRRNLQSNVFFARYGVLVSPFKERYFYWEVVLMLRKVFLICLVDLTNGMAISERSFILICFLFAEMFSDVLVNPFKDKGLPISEIRNM
jgi:hypothetical protein